MIRRSSLLIKLAVAFVVVAFAGLGLVAFYVWRATVGEFSTFMVAHNRYDFVDRWADYYREHGSWQGVEFEIRPEPTGAEPRPAQPADWIARSRVAVVDAEGRVIIAGQGFERGQIVSRVLTRDGVPITVDGEEVGRLLLGFVPNETQPASDRFLQRFNLALILGGGGAALLALLLGVGLATSLTRPLRELRTAAEAVSRGEQVQPIPVRTRDELGDLASSFNLMTSELGRAQQLRRQMTADIAHELRTPLSLILGHAEAIEDGVLAPDHETIGIIYDEAQRLSRLVDDLRTLSLSDAGELSLITASVSPVALLESAAAAHRVAAHEVGVTLTVDAPDDLPKVEIDPDRIAQVLHNLITNALRYSPEGAWIALAAEMDEAFVKLSVCDEGPGISPEELPNIFERFYRADRARQREGGSGLGLTIARSLVERHGGRIWAESEPGQGATLSFTLPAATLS